MNACRTFVSEVITGYLPSLILQLFLKAIPPVMRLLTCTQGYISYSEIDKSACSKVLWFTIWNIFFANVLSGSVLNQISILLEPKNIPSKLAVAVPAQVCILSCFKCLFLNSLLEFHCMTLIFLFAIITSSCSSSGV